DAEAVVTGTVESIVPLSPQRQRAAQAALTGTEDEGRPAPVTEHDVHWSAAVVDVHKVIKGRPASKVTIVFPKSDDIFWKDFAASSAELISAAKAKAEGKREPRIFVLNKDVLPGARLQSALLGGPAVENLEAESFTAKASNDI